MLERRRLDPLPLEHEEAEAAGAAAAGNVPAATVAARVVAINLLEFCFLVPYSVCKGKLERG